MSVYFLSFNACSLDIGWVWRLGLMDQIRVFLLYITIVVEGSEKPDQCDTFLNEPRLRKAILGYEAAHKRTLNKAMQCRYLIYPCTFGISNQHHTPFSPA